MHETFLGILILRIREQVTNRTIIVPQKLNIICVDLVIGIKIYLTFIPTKLSCYTVIPYIELQCSLLDVYQLDQSDGGITGQK